MIGVRLNNEYSISDSQKDYCYCHGRFLSLKFMLIVSMWLSQKAFKHVVFLMLFEYQFSVILQWGKVLF